MKITVTLVFILCSQLCRAQHTPIPHTTLPPVTVQAKSPVTRLPDGFRYDATKDLPAGGETAADLLRKLPAVIINADGLPTVRGSALVKVFIDGKPAEALANSVRDALQQVPAANITRVEVITNPSAKYDGEGVDAVIRIYTKKPAQNGGSGNVDITGGTRNGQLTGDGKWRTGRWILGAEAGSYFYSNQNISQILRKDRSAAAGSLFQQTNQDRRNHSDYAGFNTIYTLDSLSWLSIGYRFGSSNNKTFSSTDNQVLAPDSVPSAFTRNTDNYANRNIHTINAGYQKSSRDKTLEWSLLGYYFIQRSSEGYSLDQLPGSLPAYQEKYSSSADNGESAFQADLSKKYKKGTTLEGGIKAIHRDFNNPSEFIPDNLRSGNFHFIFSIYAAYTSVTIPVKKWMLRAGLRYEHTDLSIWFKDTALTIPPYKNPLPNILLSRTFDNGHSLSFSYTKKIMRPYIFYLNPTINYTDTFNLRFGNPYLRPEITHTVEAAYSWRKNNWLLYTSIFFSRTQNSIQEIAFLRSDGVAENTYRNIASNDVTGWTGNLSYQYKKITINSNNVLRYMVFNGASLGISNQGFVLSANLQFAYKFSDAFSSGVYINFNSPRLYLQGSSTGWRSVTCWMNKGLLNKKLNLSLRVDNPFSAYQYIRNRDNTTGFYQDGENRFLNRFFKIGLTYKFGKKEVKLPSSRTISNE